MADNIAVTAGTGTTIAADDVGGVLHQRVKATWGPDGTGNDIDVATGKPLPVQMRSATGLIPIGEPTDAKSTATDTTSASLISVNKQISASVQTLVSTGLAITNANANVQSGAPVTTIAVVPTATANGATASRVNAAATTNATSLKASAGQIYSIDVFNPAAYSVFLKLYNKASAPTVGTDTPVWTIPVPAGGGFSKEFPRGKTFATGIAYAITKLQADSDTTVVVALDLTGTIDWI